MFLHADLRSVRVALGDGVDDYTVALEGKRLGLAVARNLRPPIHQPRHQHGVDRLEHRVAGHEEENAVKCNVAVDEGLAIADRRLVSMQRQPQRVELLVAHVDSGIPGHRLLDEDAGLVEVAQALPVAEHHPHGAVERRRDLLDRRGGDTRGGPTR